MIPIHNSPTMVVVAPLQICIRHLKSVQYELIDSKIHLNQAGILIPKRVTKYVESYHPAVPTNYQMRLVFCPNTIMEPAACVKLNGWHNGNQ
ncbi:unnamed protein product [Litomosoides sigmodontis]|uniref:Uncharacterized protein n=1 Tax=Litomosoides sigmodontis TaxID=42156 RepID=A0A3P6TAB5_LITSI|nr:unnamed protein product [Litomosoides sigmodontis]